jgi:hypothetical protein
MTDPAVWNNNVAFDPDSDMVSGADTDAIGSVDEMHYDADVEVSIHSDDFYTDIDGSSTVLADPMTLIYRRHHPYMTPTSPPVSSSSLVSAADRRFVMFPKRNVYDLNRRVRPKISSLSV